ncbi:TolC family protein [Winogradskyella immobilis]|uniref:TolC family protein n=1 Tax=Winogradskyella immobilis TaxID=2816852 RepID=A0ABS8ENK1_9FLAO|nr:TolC family protein [Winogradskyella immobilis]MCC1484723.1 TolC family protein [Winogradskyella immobilis]
MRYLYIIIFMSAFSTVDAQNTSIKEVLGFDEYLGFVKKFHPIVKQAELVIDESQAKLLKSRGAFDPKIEVDYDRKKFKSLEYFDKLNATFKVPTWYGIELKANFEENTGVFLNPEADVPEGGLYSAGFSFSAARGLLINERMAALKQAKLFKEQAKADRDIYVNNILFEASVVYFEWLKAYKENQVFENFLVNAEQRFLGVKRGVEVGERAAIDSIEARIAVNDRKLNFEKTRVKLIKASLKLSNYLWLDDNTPLELQDNIIPNVNSERIIDDTFNTSALRENEFSVDQHPKLLSLDYKKQNLNLERRLKANKLLPKIDLEYNFLSETPRVSRSFSTSEYKAGVNISYPLFLRKERGDLKLAKLKIKDVDYEINATRIKISNKVTATQKELDSYVIQNGVMSQMITDYTQMLRAEERKFQLGESSLFLVNSRESKLIDGQLKAIELQKKYYTTKAKLFNSLAVNPEL